MVTALVGLLGTLLGGGITLLGQWFMASRQQTNQFRLAALDKRLDVHQEAYALWHDMVSVIHDVDKRGDAVIRAQQWWFKNCLYLDPRVRKEFYWCSNDVFSYDAQIKECTTVSWKRIIELGDLIAAGVNLPSIGDPEKVAMPTPAKGKEGEQANA